MDDLEKIHQKYADDVKRFLIGLTQNVDLAEEITQETFYQATKSINRYNGECKMSVWLCQIAKHTYYNYLKKEQKYKKISIDELDYSLKDCENLIEIKMIKRDKYISVYKEIHLLHEPYREIFLLRTLSELSFKEIGEIFLKNENWARVTYYRAKTKLLERIKNDEL